MDAKLLHGYSRRDDKKMGGPFEMSIWYLGSETNCMNWEIAVFLVWLSSNLLFYLDIFFVWGLWPNTPNYCFWEYVGVFLGFFVCD
jgi:hypothetical protein